MAKQTAKTRNPDRRNGKAWGKSHNATVKVLSTEAQERKAHKDAERERRRVSHGGGSSVTMPSFDWQWFGEVMRGIHTHTRRLRMVDACMAQERSKA